MQGKFCTEALATICGRYQIQSLALFGSMLQGEHKPDSDMDILVVFQPWAKIGFFELCEVEIELSKLFKRKVDLRTPEDLSRYFREEVVSTARELYAA